MNPQVNEDHHLCTVCEKLDLSLTNNREKETKYSLGTMADVYKRWKDDTHCQFCRLVFSFMGGRIDDSDVSLSWKPKSGFNRGTVGHNIVFLNEDSAISPYGSGREVRAQIDTTLMKKWLQLCELHHSSTCTFKGKAIKPEEDSTGIHVLRLIDTQDLRIVNARPGVRYITLSYVWGQAIQVKLLRGNLEHFSSTGALGKEALPKTIRDAIDLVQLIGERYLWVDCLCLVQDDPDDLAYGIAKMDLIFLGATLTIIAAHGEDANAGLPGLHPGSREASQLVVEVKPGVKMTKIEGVYDSLSGSRHNSRGWTLQEVTLSHRLLVFTSKRIYFRCRQNCWGEDIIFDKFPLQINEALHSGSGVTFFDDNGVDPLSNLISLLFRYAERDLTYQYDTINGFAGMLRQLGIQLESGLLEGIHTAYFDIGLLFWDMFPRLRIQGRRSEFPSWSWAGWRGGKYGFGAFCGNVEKARIWLQDMTYIEWYKREPSTLKLEPLWTFEGRSREEADRVLNQDGIGGRAPSATIFAHSVHRVFKPALSDDEAFKEQIRLDAKDRNYHLLQFWAQVVRFAELALPDGMDEDASSAESESTSNEDEDSETSSNLGENEEDTESEDDDEAESGAVSDTDSRNTHSEEDAPEVSGEWAHIYKILSSDGVICGGIKLDDPSLVPSLDGPHEFILLSRVDRYESFFNNIVKTDRQIYWVMLIEWLSPRRVVAERRGIGFVFWDCLDRMLSPGRVWKEIVLA